MEGERVPDAGNLSGRDGVEERARSTPPEPRDSTADDADVFADETNLWPARTAARFLTHQARRYSERSTLQLCHFVCVAVGNSSICVIIRPYRMHRMDAAYCSTCRTFRCLCVCL